MSRSVSSHRLQQIVLMFMMGLLGAIGSGPISLFSLVGTVGLFCLVIWTGKLRTTGSGIRWIIVLVGVLLAAYLVADLVNNSPIGDALSRWVLMLLLALLIVAVLQAFGTSRFAQYCALFSGLFAGIGLMRLVFLDFPSSALIFKSCAEFFLYAALLMALALGGKFGRMLMLGTLFFIVMLATFFDSRAILLAGISGLILHYFALLFNRNVSIFGFRISRGAILFAGILCFASVLSSGGMQRLQDAVLPEGIRYEQQQGGLGSLVGSRIEILGTFSAIRDRPILGHGSWAKNHEYVSLADYYASVNGYSRRIGGLKIYDDNRIPNHSMLFGVWMEAGIFAFVAFLGLVIWVVRRVLSYISAIAKNDRSSQDVGVTAGVVAVLFVWNSAFSALSFDRLFYLVFVLTFVSLVTQLAAKARPWESLG